MYGHKVRAKWRFGAHSAVFYEWAPEKIFPNQFGSAGARQKCGPAMYQAVGDFLFGKKTKQKC